MNVFRKPFVVLLTVPAGIALTIGFLPFLTVLVEEGLGKGAFSPYVVQFEIDSARTVLSVVATSAMTALSLAYSLVLVVFTLAAANVGPRLLKRFSTELVNQVTAGILGGTFLYALITLLFVHPDFLPKFTVAGSVFLAVICVVQLIYFVRNVSESVTIDDEIASISRRLKDDLKRLASNGSEKVGDIDESLLKYEITAPTSGYIGAVETKKLLALAKKQDFLIRLDQHYGAFLLEEQPLVSLSKEVSEEDGKAIAALIAIEPSRSETGAVQFSVKLLVEIALRALSPGMNDVYTAIACVDNLTNAFATVGDEGIQMAVHCDEDGKARLILRGLSIKELLGGAFYPIRRACGTNILMAQGLARAYARLYFSGGAEMGTVVTKHAKLLLEQLRAGSQSDHDINSVVELLPEPLRTRD